MKNHDWKWIAAGGLVGLSGISIGVAYAHGVPTDPLVYSGTLLQDGSHPTGATNVTVSLYDMPTGGTRLCVSDPTLVDPATGRFSATLGSDCRAAIQAHTSVYVQVAVVGASASTWPLRSALQPVPYALEADHAAESDHAGSADGANRTGLTHAGATVSGGGGWCGFTSPVDGAIGSYASANVLCRTACTSATAHICSAEEMVRSAGLSMIPRTPGTSAYAWYASGIDSTSAGDFYNDCAGYQSRNATTIGTAWETASNYPSAVPCNNMENVACCD